MLKYIMMLLFGILFTAFAILSTIYYAWLTATPLGPEQLRQAQGSFYGWLFTSVLALGSTVGVIVRMILFQRARYRAEGT